ncbi:hypothetical protein NFI96_004015 [Prochilodus magdalenae]|nr:hypothetical protein NFI96_004015 [Prochilodus magdalenae]
MVVVHLHWPLYQKRLTPAAVLSRYSRSSDQAQLVILRSLSSGQRLTPDSLWTSCSQGSVWKLKVGVSDIVASVWKLKAGVTDIVASVWKLKAGVSDIVASVWKLKAGVTDIVASVWKLKAGVSDIVASVWKLKAGVTDIVASVWKLKAVLQSETVWKNNRQMKVFLPNKLLECLPRMSTLPKERLRWNTNEEIASYLISFDRHEEWLSCTLKTRLMVMEVACCVASDGGDVLY